jgi:predicted nicotinamide N-methyase
MTDSLWVTTKIDAYTFHLLNLDHPDLDKKILGEIKSGISVYYDRRWEATEVFSRFLIDHQAWIKDRKVLVLGAGIGVETLVIGRLCSKMYINDLAPIALSLCSQQLKKNHINNYDIFQGRYETLNFPPADIIVGSYLIYNRETLKAMQRLLDINLNPVILMNEPLPSFKKFIQTTKRKVTYLLDESRFICILVE